MTTHLKIVIRYPRRARLAVLTGLLCLALAILGAATYAGGQAALAATQTSTSLTLDWPRSFYLTPTAQRGDQAAAFCDAGYHMASIWEILNTTNLKYASNRGASHADAGLGPPSYYAGWVRTGYLDNISLTPGMANCNSWTSQDPLHHGTAVYLTENWSAGGDLYVWRSYTTQCSNLVSVWCVADHAGQRLYLPLVQR